MSGRDVESHKKNGDVWKWCRESEIEGRYLERVYRVRRRPKMSGRGV